MVLSRGITLRVISVVVTAITIATGLLLFKESAQAQTPSGALPYSMILTPERALAFVQAADRNLGYLPGEVLVKFKAGATTTGQQRALMALRSRPPVSDLQWISGDTALHRDPVEWDATILAAQLAEQPEVAYAEPNYLRHSNATPNNPGFARQWNFTALDLPRAWDINPGAKANIIVAVIDTGITTVNQTFTFPTWNGTAIQNVSVPFRTNPELSSTRVVSPQDFIFWNGPVLDMVGHASHVSGTIGEDTNNGVAEAGIAYNASIMPVKVCVGFWEIQFAMSSRGVRGYAPLDSGGCLSAATAQGIRYAADNGAKVINLSLGGSQPAAIEQDALNYAVSKGAFVAISAGNSYDKGNLVEYPAGFAASIDGVMSVGAVGPSLTRAFYSNTGSYVEIAAPGGNDREGGINGMIWQATICQFDSDSATVIFPRFDRYCETPEEGTSMAAPHVSGAAALIMSQGVTNPAAVEALIKKTARPLGSGGRNNEYGFGLIQPRAALFGFGLAK
jgi:serine protease